MRGVIFFFFSFSPYDVVILLLVCVRLFYPTIKLTSDLLINDFRFANSCGSTFYDKIDTYGFTWSLEIYRFRLFISQFEDVSFKK